jgi:hypothetical protein
LDSAREQQRIAAIDAAALERDARADPTMRAAGAFARLGSVHFFEASCALH